MKVQKVGKLISLILFSSGLLAFFDVIANFSQHGLILFLTVVFQLIYSVVFYFALSRASSPDYINRCKRCCWVGIIYIVSFSPWMSFRQYEEFGFTFLLPLTIFFSLAISISPFIWMIKNLK
jgi:hypothetical protein